MEQFSSEIENSFKGQLTWLKRAAELRTVIYIFLHICAMLMYNSSVVLYILVNTLGKPNKLAI